MNPKPLSSLNHLTVPVLICLLLRCQVPGTRRSLRATATSTGTIRSPYGSIPTDGSSWGPARGLSSSGATPGRADRSGTSPRGRLRPCRLVGEDRDPLADEPAVGQAHAPRRRRAGEQPPAAAEDYGEDHQPQLVEEVVLDQRPHQLAASRDQDRPLPLLL